ncbi:MAG: DUF2062 domain-containing protein [Opitutus sp.]|nr:DUF2062 domain-containing protein [Opitutus sp.]
MRLPFWFFRLLHKQKLSRHKMRGGRIHGWFGDRILDKALWLPTRNSLARAWLIGFPITVVPFLPGQSVFATIGALMVRGNLLLCIAMQFLSNPATAFVQIPACYFVGAVVRGAHPGDVWQEIPHVTKQFLHGDWKSLGEPVISLYVGAIIIGFLGGLAGYAFLHQTWKDKPKRHPRSSTESRPPMDTGTQFPL